MIAVRAVRETGDFDQWAYALGPRLAGPFVAERVGGGDIDRGEFAGEDPGRRRRRVSITSQGSLCSAAAVSRSAASAWAMRVSAATSIERLKT